MSGYIPQEEVREKYPKGAVWCIVFGNHGAGQPFTSETLYREIRDEGIRISDGDVEALLGQWVNKGALERTRDHMRVIPGVFPIGS